MTFQEFTYNPNETIKEQYEVRSCIGEGSEGEVYLVWDKCAKRLLAMKVIFFEDTCKVQNYEKQVQMLTQFGGTYFPVLVNNFAEKDKGYILMEYVEGESLKTLIERTGSLEVKEALGVIMEIGNAIKQLHGAVESVVFGDLKADNIMIQKDFKVKIIDFGGAFYAGEKVDGQRVGTLGYAPKEQWEKGKSAQKWWDVFALNKVLHYMLTGNNPALPPYTTPSILEFDITLPKALDDVLTRYNCEEVCERMEAEEYLRLVSAYKKTEGRNFLKEFAIKFVEYMFVCGAVLLFYLNVWEQSLEDIVSNRKSILISLLLFLVAILYRKIFVHKGFSYRYQREKNVWKSAKKGMYIFLVLLLFTEHNSKAEGEKQSLLPLIFYNDARESVCIGESAVLKISENLMMELPIESVMEGEIYELEISCKLQGEKGELKRKILFEKKP